MQNWEGTAKEQCEVQAPCSSEMTTAEDSESEWKLGGEGKQSWERRAGKAPGAGSSLFYPGEAENESGRTVKDLSKSKSLKWAYRPVQLKQNDTTHQAAPC